MQHRAGGHEAPGDKETLMARAFAKIAFTPERSSRPGAHGQP